MLSETRRLLVVLDKAGGDPKKYEGGKGGYWDDLCLAKFLEGVCLRYIAYPVSHSFLGSLFVVGFGRLALITVMTMLTLVVFIGSGRRVGSFRGAYDVPGRGGERIRGGLQRGAEEWADDRVGSLFSIQYSCVLQSYLNIVFGV
jgi:hypothetical protein